ncbi:S-methyl-5'-thioadenosine phosphorylase [Aeromicrobium sp.]|uniref:S-methyl-5'-thioadenosine phosphorylase n=1 Tax=Aeromicrobium sp. TaxID=1871063 RepID=UPI0025BA709B|nr:S-methyl-5'-thioadenosine phosphorylase [Aeromicrobium sp.]MCK5890824.1 S-methyl-5'-thioadenosine phosphorylase [Aeromicrobium sp.]
MNTPARPEIAVIGGSGFYTFLEAPETVELQTPYGAPSAPISIGTVDGRSVAFLPRHGPHHQFPAHQVPYRANLWALRSLGVRQILAPCAVGGLRPELGPGTFVVPDQLVDRTSGRVQTYFDEGAVHVSFADPYCPRLRSHLVDGLQEHAPVDGGTMVVIEGPRFSTRAESQWYAAQGGAIINMTGHPEAVLARELALCYATVALVTDHDAGVDASTSVSMDEVFAVFASHTDTLKGTLRTVVGSVGARDCACGSSVDGMNLPVELP